MHAHQHEFRITTMCRVLKVERSGYYAWLAKPRSARSIEDARLLKLIEEASLDCDGGLEIALVQRFHFAALHHGGDSVVHQLLERWVVLSQHAAVRFALLRHANDFPHRRVFRAGDVAVKDDVVLH